MPDEIRPALTTEEWERSTFWPARHMIAALALYGQPFGFSQEDVNVIRRMAEQEDEMFGEFAEAKRLTSLAARIAALLPPA